MFYWLMLNYAKTILCGLAVGYNVQEVNNGSDTNVSVVNTVHNISTTLTSNARNSHTEANKEMEEILKSTIKDNGIVTLLLISATEKSTVEDIFSSIILNYSDSSANREHGIENNNKLFYDSKSADRYRLFNAKEVNNPLLVKFAPIPFERRTLLDQIITKIFKYITVSRTTPKSTTPDLHAVYLHSNRIRQIIKKKMIKYKKRKVKNRKIDVKLGTRRGIPKKTTTPTKRVPMRKSKYYIRKYVRKNLYKMTTTTPKPTRDPWLYWTKEKVAKRKKSKRQKLLERYLKKQNRET